MSPPASPVFDAAAMLPRVLDRDREAWTAFVDQYQRLVWSVVATSFVSIAEREDVTQMVFLRLAERLHTVEDPAKLTAFVGSVAKFTSWECHRSAKRHQPANADLADAPSNDDVAAESLRRQQAGVVVRSLQALSETCQELLRLFFGAELTTREVADQLELEEGTVRVRKSRCLGELRKVDDVKRLLLEGVDDA